MPAMGQKRSYAANVRNGWKADSATTPPGVASEACDPIHPRIMRRIFAALLYRHPPSALEPFALRQSDGTLLWRTVHFGPIRAKHLGHGGMEARGTGESRTGRTCARATVRAWHPHN